MNKRKIGIIGFAQMHITTMLETFLKMPEQFECIGISDTFTDLEPTATCPSSRLGVRKAVQSHCPNAVYYDRYTDLIDAKPEVIIVTCENSLHLQVALAALRRGIHVILEKPMAMSLSEAIQMETTARMNQALLMINWPTSWMPAFRTAQRLTREGVVGRILRFSYTNAESLGPFSYGQTMSKPEMSKEWWYHRNLGGGCPVDYLGYGCNLSRWFIGERALTAMACARNFLIDYADVEDHATLVLQFRQAQALIEGTWSTFSAGHVPSGPILYGDRGTLVTDKKDGTVALYTRRYQTEPTIVFENDSLPENRASLAQEYLYALENGQPHETLSASMNVDAMAAMDAALRSIRFGKIETVVPGI